MRPCFVMAATPEPTASDLASLLQRSVTFKPNALPLRPPAGSTPPSTGTTLQNLTNRILGSKVAPSNRVSESLDYEPCQNKVFYDRMNIKKDGKKKLWG